MKFVETLISVGVLYVRESMVEEVRKIGVA